MKNPRKTSIYKHRLLYRGKLLLIALIAIYISSLSSCKLCNNVYDKASNLYNKYNQAQIDKKTAKAKQQIIDCQELITYKCKYTTVEFVKRSAAFGLLKSDVVYKFTGNILGGIADVSAISFEVSNKGRDIQIELPHCEILGNDIEKEETLDESSDLFIRVSLTSVAKDRQEAKDKEEEKLVKNGFLQEADNNASDTMTKMMNSIGFKNVSITWKE